MTDLSDVSQVPALMLALLLSLSALLLAKRFQFFKLPENKIFLKPTFFQMVGSFLVYLIVSLLVIPLIYVILFFLFKKGDLKSLHDVPKEWKEWLQVLGLFLVCFGLLTYCLYNKTTTKWIVWRNHLPSFQRAYKDFGMGAMTWLISYPLVLCASIASGIVSQWIWGKSGVEQVAVKQLLDTKGHPLLFAAMAIAVIIIVPFIEELLFRGFLHNWLKRKIGRMFGLFLTAFIFALVHFSPSQGIGNFELIISLFTLSCFLGFIYERQETLWASFGLHSTFNAISVISLIFMKN